MNLSKKNKRLLFSIFLFIIFLTLGTPPAKQIIPTDLQKILFLPSVAPKKNVAGSEISSDIKLHKVDKVIDGDTILIDTGQKIRYIGIDSPESKDPRTSIKCFALEATERNIQLVLGKVVRLERDISETDRYGRLLRYVYIDDDLINEQLVKEGYALASPYPPDIKYQKLLEAAEGYARKNKSGLWNSCVN